MIRRLLICAVLVANIPFVNAADKTSDKHAASAPADAVINPTSLIMKDVKVGTGAEAAAGKQVSVNYTGWLYDPSAPDRHGAKFDSSIGRGPFTFPLGAGMVIKGWDQGVAGMRVGGKRTLVIPSDLAYGKRGAGGGLIPPDATLIFDVELLDVK